MSEPWWKVHQGRLEYELDELKRIGVGHQIDQPWFERGILRLDLTVPVRDGDSLHAEVLFPDLYPYFRPEIRAPSLRLPYHQQRCSHALCLLGRPTENWHPHLTLAWLIEAQLPKVLSLGNDQGRGRPLEGEEHQAEPFSDYYPYPPSMILIDRAWTMPADEPSGPMEIGLVDEQLPSRGPFVRGAVLSISSNRGNVLHRASQSISKIFHKRIVRSRWVQVQEPIEEFDPDRFLDRVRRLDLGAKQNQAFPLWQGRFILWGVVFREERTYRAEEKGQGWVFIVHGERKVPVRRAGFIPTRKDRK